VLAHRHDVASLIPSTRQAWAILMPSLRSASAFSSFTTICSGVCCTVLDLLAWFPNNVARNFHVNLSSIEIALLELQRLWQMLKIQGRELHARFMGTP